MQTQFDREGGISPYKRARVDAVRTIEEGLHWHAHQGLLFQTRNGIPLTLTNILRRHLHLALKKLGYLNPHPGDHKAAAMRSVVSGTRS